MSFQAIAAQAQIHFSNATGLFLSDATGNRTQLELPTGQPDGYQAEIAYFVDCCRTQTPPTRCSPRASATAVHIALCLKRSRSLNGEPIPCL
jgi:hypothetical protein